MEQAKAGDIIRCKGRVVKIGKIYDQYPPSDFTNGAWLIEGEDSNGIYFYWKQQFDGGTLERRTA